MKHFIEKIMGKIKCFLNFHDLDGCLCRRCKYVNYTGHNFVNCRCSICGQMRHYFNKTIYDKNTGMYLEKCRDCGVTKHTCYVCYGSGVKRCRNCDGDGIVSTWIDYCAQNPGPCYPCPDHTEERVCPECNGEGVIYPNVG